MAIILLQLLSDKPIAVHKKNREYWLGLIKELTHREDLRNMLQSMLLEVGSKKPLLEIATTIAVYAKYLQERRLAILGTSHAGKSTLYVLQYL